MQLNELPLRSEILRAASELGFENTTEIQEKAIPVVLEGRDITGQSSTGTGKTAAFGLPIVEIVSKLNDKQTVLILSPTRELAVQTAGEIRKFSKYIPGVPIAVLYGGASMSSQITQLRTAKIVIGTPGRVMDHLRRRTLKLDKLKIVVLDEADEMLNMGFIDDINTILQTAPEDRQMLLFSATMSPDILRISKQYQNDPVAITVESGQRTATNIDQSYYNIPQASKLDALKLLLEFHRPKQALVFCNTKKMVDELASSLTDSGFKAAGIHGDLRQNQRDAVMSDFKHGRVSILVATDVAARGIDVNNVEAVFNFDIPMEQEYYIHRIGRTGRAGKSGASYTLAANRNQVSKIREIERYIKAPIIEKPIPSIESIADHRTEQLVNELIDGIEQGVGNEWKDFIVELKQKGISIEDISAVLCAKLYRKNNRLANVRNVAVASTASGKKALTAIAGQGWIRIDIGSDQKIGPNFIVSAIADASGMKSSKIGKINIYADHTDVSLPLDEINIVLTTCKGISIKGRPVHFKRADKPEGRTHSENRSGKNQRSGKRAKSDDFKPRRSYSGDKPHDFKKPKKDKPFFNKNTNEFDVQSNQSHPNKKRRKK